MDDGNRTSGIAGSRRIRDTAHAAARDYDRAAIKFRGMDADINFSIANYLEDIGQVVLSLELERGRDDNFSTMLRRIRR